ncbi:MAG: hypothetical protein QGG38_08575 [Nitrospinaceae bacterium]|nr:hypothetical protein [Nitrospinaceae bacterium]MDP6712713.1 hypothetical protein [Nitrospinaceae bacterium]MDP7058566.1 hypothetical protein [Nitrospinaceae bacterium]
MVLGTGSGVGKSIITAALCRYFYRKGRKVAPLKPRIWLIIHLSPGMRVK